MKGFLFFSLIFTSSLCLGTSNATDPRTLRDTPAAQTTVATCEAALPAMRDAMATMRAGHTLSENQETVWRTWNRDCRHASWQHALADGLPPVPEQPTFGTPLPPPTPPTLTWRHYALAALQGLERGLTAPMIYCRQTTLPRKGTLYTYSYCY